MFFFVVVAWVQLFRQSGETFQEAASQTNSSYNAEFWSHDQVIQWLGDEYKDMIGKDVDGAYLKYYILNPNELNNHCKAWLKDENISKTTVRKFKRKLISLFKCIIHVHILKDFKSDWYEMTLIKSTQSRLNYIINKLSKLFSDHYDYRYGKLHHKKYHFESLHNSINVPQRSNNKLHNKSHKQSKSKSNTSGSDDSLSNTNSENKNRLLRQELTHEKEIRRLQKNLSNLQYGSINENGHYTVSIDDENQFDNNFLISCCHIEVASAIVEFLQHDRYLVAELMV